MTNDLPQEAMQGAQAQQVSGLHWKIIGTMVHKFMYLLGGYKQTAHTEVFR